MRKIKVGIVLFVVFVACASIQTANAQKYKNYYLEVGLLGGGSFYLGDANNTLFNNMLPTGGAFIKYRFNHHWELKFQTTLGQAGIGVFDKQFRYTTFGDGALMAEFNFFNYGAGPFEPYASNVTPYIFAGIGASVFNSSISGIVPFGLGVKYRFGQRWNLGAYWSMQKTIGSDNFDLIDNPLNTNAGIWNNNDWYSTAAVFISVDLWERCAACGERPKYIYRSY